MPDLLAKVQKAKLIGLGGASYPVFKKWQAIANQDTHLKYLVCNGAEGEPGVKKDGYLLKHSAWEVFDGIFLTAEYLGISKIFFFINPEYYHKYSKELRKLAQQFNLDLDFTIKEKHSYISGEESAILNIIEGKRAEPRLKPPYPSQAGLWGWPTLIHNIETLYNISLVNSNNYKGNRLYTINLGNRLKKIVSLPVDWTIEKILRETGLYPDYDFFVQIGGNASGEVLNQKQLKRKVSGAGSITIYNKKEHDPWKLMKYWLKFYRNQSCGQCTACREGTYRLWEIINSPDPNWVLFNELLDNLVETPICGLGTAVPVPVHSYLKNIGRFYEKS